MSNKTTNFGLTKPLPEEFYDVNVQNENMDIIDKNMFSCKPTELTSSNDLNKITIPGFYYWAYNNKPLNIPENSADLQHMIVYNLSSGVTMQEITCPPYDNNYANRGCMVRRVINYNTPHPWEWVNPPMKFGVEYRTTERFNSKAVYVKVVNFGNLPNSTSKSVAVGVYPADVVKLDVTLYKSTAAISSPFVALDSFEIQSRCFVVSTGNLMMETKTDLSEYTAVAIIKYTK